MFAHDFDDAVAFAVDQQVEDFAVFGMGMGIDGAFFITLRIEDGDDERRTSTQGVHDVEQDVVVDQAREFDVEALDKRFQPTRSPLSDACSSRSIMA